MSLRNQLRLIKFTDILFTLLLLALFALLCAALILVLITHPKSLLGLFGLFILFDLVR